jgi:photosystem II stability/assembly factor-like uncharacterized protein
MKKSRTIQLTVVTALSIAARAQQAPTTPSVSTAPQSCEERRNAAQLAGVAFKEACGHGGHGAPAHAVAHGGFGATGEGHNAGG